ncbi:28S ribosomal protein S5, mitochondrial [Zootermopsis nevadensis]|uniref:Small ribosomal subunit protein uS5m n=1 Tax=Zootermopsis nevadensis TaxID=136037 RepID=A0A067QVQ5_ZOONE|nr:28S ribosomal protein S5, mitochondrial [Zootermopsis nevadensis]XP_021931544.1 28S ribosomal protein S5, mitochondrial [Zootermopsis nevadensis]KDR13269.1 28S ribosomal protein S5, mitochondrial [Zootermopsis nevadensis]
MSASVLRLNKVLGKCVYGVRLTKDVLNTSQRVQNMFTTCANVPILTVAICTPISVIVRNTSFFNKLPAEALWKGVTSVSNAGRKRGRGKGIGKKMAKDLNRGQVIGVGKSNIIWPGLTVPVLRGRELVQQQKLPEDPEREKMLIKLRDDMGNFRPLRLSPIERGWSGTKMPGRSIGPPDPVGEETFEGFDTKVLELKSVFNMKGSAGRKRQISAFVVTGNKNGSAGIALGKALEAKAALRKAKNRAGQKMMYLEIFNNHTVYHDFFCQFGKTKIFVTKKPEGFGLVCHRAIKTTCEVIGIKDLYAKVEGPTNLQHIIKAFFIGLLHQKTHQMLADEKKLHVVEFREENDYFPTVVASPATCRTLEEINADEVMDYTQYALGNRVFLKKKRLPPFFTKLPSWENYLKKTQYTRNRDKVKVTLLAEYDEVQSFYTEKYPECVHGYREQTEAD